MVVRGHSVNKTREYSGTGVNEREVGSFDWEAEYWGTTVFIWVLIAFIDTFIICWWGQRSV